MHISQPCAEGRTMCVAHTPLQLTYIPRLLAEYIQYNCIFSKMHIPQPCTKAPSRRRAVAAGPNSRKNPQELNRRGDTGHHEGEVREAMFATKSPSSSSVSFRS